MGGAEVSISELKVGGAEDLEPIRIFNPEMILTVNLETLKDVLIG